jgi:hypothetical protein
LLGGGVTVGRDPAEGGTVYDGMVGSPELDGDE